MLAAPTMGAVGMPGSPALFPGEARTPQDAELGLTHNPCHCLSLSLSQGGHKVSLGQPPKLSLPDPRLSDAEAELLTDRALAALHHAAPVEAAKAVLLQHHRLISVPSPAAQ